MRTPITDRLLETEEARDRYLARPWNQGCIGIAWFHAVVDMIRHEEASGGDVMASIRQALLMADRQINEAAQRALDTMNASTTRPPIGP